MATPTPVHLNLLPELYARIQEIADRSAQPLETVLLDSLALLFNVPTVDGTWLADRLDTLSDAQLWAVVHRRLAWASAERLRELVARGKRDELTVEEQDELAALIEEADRMTLLRTQALRLLQERGQPVREYLRRGA